jgi:hypothetical protein
MGVTVKILPRYIELRRDSFQSWLLVCRACGIKESYRSFWPASYAAHAHGDMHEAEEDGPAPTDPQGGTGHVPVS